MLTANFFRLPLALLAICLSLAAIAGADEPAKLNLLIPGSLAGWDQGQPIEGWQFSGNDLVASAGASKLTSAWTFGDFKLSFKWHTVGAGISRRLSASPRWQGGRAAAPRFQQ